MKACIVWITRVGHSDVLAPASSERPRRGPVLNFAANKLAGRDCVLQREVDADATGGRHGVGAVTNAKQAFLGKSNHGLDDWTKIKTPHRPRSIACENGIAKACFALVTAPTPCRPPVASHNLALQDAVATANLLAGEIRTGPVSVAHLKQVQERREWPTRVIQTMQAFIHRRVVTGRESKNGNSLPLCPGSFNGFRHLRSLPARFIGLGPKAGAHSFAESELDAFSSFGKAEKRRDRADSVSQFLRHRQLDPDRRDGGAITQTVHH